MVSNQQMIKKYKKINNNNNNKKKEINLRFPQNYLEFFFKSGFVKFDKLSLGGGWIYLLCTLDTF